MTVHTVTTKISQSQLYPESNTSNVHGLRRLHSYPSGSDTDQDVKDEAINYPMGKPPVPERNSELLSRYGHKKLPPPVPLRTSSSNRSPLASPTSPNLPPLRSSELQNNSNTNNNNIINNNSSYTADQDSGSESNNSQDNNSQRLRLEMRHQELLKKQKHLQEQYQRLQKMSKNSIPLATNEQNLVGISNVNENADQVNDNITQQQPQAVTTNKIYQTEIL